jgi:hypothetical protein
MSAIAQPQAVTVYRGHEITRRPYGRSRTLYECKCKYAGASHPASQFSLKAMKAEIDTHLTATYTLASRRFSGTLPRCPGGAE